MLELILIILVVFWILYYVLCHEEMKGQHPVRKIVWYVFIPTCLNLIPLSFIVPIPINPLDLIFTLVLSIALGEVFDTKENSQRNT